jgi:hypothetical protein
MGQGLSNNDQDLLGGSGNGSSGGGGKANNLPPPENYQINGYVPIIMGGGVKLYISGDESSLIFTW